MITLSLATIVESEGATIERAQDAIPTGRGPV